MMLDVYDRQGPQAIERCAWYLRVSTPRQKLEHQREHVEWFCRSADIHIPEVYRFEDKEKRHKAAKRAEFQRLLDTVRQGRLDWIIICSFDRWGVADVDEFFEFRRLLLQHSVQLWSVVDQMNLTGISEGDYFRIVAMAVGATRYVDQMAEKNILKMIEMAKQGWAASGNAPFGLDLVCYPLCDLYRPLFRVVRLRYRPFLCRILTYDAESRVERDPSGIIVGSRLTVIKDETVDRMPPRDKKATGYRYEPTIEESRLKAVNLAYEMYATGMGWAEIASALWKLGYQHYDTPFQDHALETILSNPAYVGLPAWGKVGTGAYRVLLNGQPTKVKRKATDTVYLAKAEDQWIQPVRPLFPPVVSPELWQRVHGRLASRGHRNPSFGRPKTRSRARHPANGKLVCPDCREKMVLGSSCPAAGGKGQKTRCFNCGTYRRNGRLKCFSNTVGFDKLDRAIAELFERVKGRIDGLVGAPAVAKSVLDEEWATKTELGRIIRQVMNAYFARFHFNFHDRSGKPRQVKDEEVTQLIEDLPLWEFLHECVVNQTNCMTFDVTDMLKWSFEWYARDFAERSAALRREMEEIDGELRRIAQEVAGGIPSRTVREHLNRRMIELERRKGEMEPQLVPLTGRADELLDQLKTIRQTIERAEKGDLARLLDAFVDKIVPIFDVKREKGGRRRAVVRGFEFHPKQTPGASNDLDRPVCVEAGGTMENARARTGTDSWPPPA
jgi:DNA invertase Pin-like site-specific DNA recombinase